MKKSLAVKLTLYSIALVLVTTATLYYLAYKLTRETLIEDIGMHMESIAQAIALEVDGDLHASIQSKEDTDGEAFTTLRDTLRKFKKGLDLNQDIYTFRPKGDSLEFVVMSHANPSDLYENKKLYLDEVINKVLKQGKAAHTGMFHATNVDYISGYAPVKDSSGKVVAVLCIDFTSTSFDAVLQERLTSIFWISVLAILLTIPLSFIAVRTITGRIKQTVVQVNQAVENKDLTITLDASGSDEMADLARSFNTFSKEVHTLIGSVAENARNLAATAELVANQSSNLQASAGDMQGHGSSMLERTREISQQMKEIAAQASSSATSVQSLTEANEGISGNLEQVHVSSEAMDRDMQELCGAVGRVSETIIEVARNVQETSQITHQATSITHATNGRVNKLREAAQEIGQVVKVITGIAEKTNLLALNASIEAARAGEAGRGFAVVATEVKELAHQTAQSTEDIQTRILDIQQSTHEALTAIGEITSVIATIDERTSTVNMAMEQQAATVEEMEAFMAQATDRSNDVNIKVSDSKNFTKEVTGRAMDALSGAKNIARRAREVADASAQSQQQTEAVNHQASKSSQAANRLGKEATALSEMSAELQRLVAQFKL